MDWALLTTASDPLSAELLVQRLREQAVEARVHPGDTAAYLGLGFLAGPCRVIVPADRLGAAVALLEEWEPDGRTSGP